MPAQLAGLRTADTQAAEASAAASSPSATPHANGGHAVSTSPNGHTQSQNDHGHDSPTRPFTHPLVGGGTDLLVQRLEELREQPACA